MRMPQKCPVHITNLRVANAGALSRVCADVNGSPLWFESRDALLTAAAEAFGSAMAPAAYALGADLIVDETVDQAWASNVRALQNVWRRWWGGRPVEIGSLGEEPHDASGAAGTALCFSGGVDSFYSLLQGPFEFDHLVFVHGYDIKLSDQARCAAAEASVREVASAVGAKAVVVRTNLREHPVFARAGWERAHGGALAAIGHLLRGFVGRFVLSASHPYWYDHPWGSHWDTDPLWSSSGLDMVHFGADQWRADKLRAVAGNPLIRRHLRVCWKHLSEHGNCGRCEKCIRTMLILAGAGQLEVFPVFGGGEGLAESVRRLPPLKRPLLKVYEDFPRDGMSPAVVEALDALLERSRGGRFSRLRWRLVDGVLNCRGTKNE